MINNIVIVIFISADYIVQWPRWSSFTIANIYPFIHTNDVVWWRHFASPESAQSC